MTTNKISRIERARIAIEKDLAICRLQDKIAREIIETVKRLSHRKVIDKTLKTAFDALTGGRYISSYTKDKDTYGQLRFSVWGDGLDYDHQVFVCCNQSELTSDGWSAVLKSVERSVMGDYIARLEKERDLLPELERLAVEADKIADAAKQLFANEAPDGKYHRCAGPSYTVREVYDILK